MLVTLQIQNFALIENATIEFGDGLNILSGETGAGKSIVIQALELLLGGRGSADVIRQGEEEAQVSGFFQSGHLPSEDSEFSLRRVISKNGKNKAYFNERPVPLSVLSEKAEGLVDVAGQHESQSLLRPDKHMELLDAFAGLTALVSNYRQSLEKFREIKKERDALERRQSETRQNEDFLRFQLKELTDAHVQAGEEETLTQERDILKNAVRLGDLCLRGDAILDSGEEPVSEKLSKLIRELSSVSSIDPQFESFRQNLEEGLIKMQEVALSLRQYGDKLGSDPDRLQEIEDRLNLLSRLKKKHGGSLEMLAEKEAEISKALSLLDHFEEEIQRQDTLLSRQNEAVTSQAKKLSSERKLAASRLTGEIEKELKNLEMSSAVFSVVFKPLEALGENGAEAVEFFLSPNKGEGAHPLAKIASGGEISRVFLAIKKVLGGGVGVETFVFDEVDAGIGGGIAEVIGKNLLGLSRKQKKQVICITHLPQIACYADHHFVIQKRVQSGRTQTDIAPLKDQDRENEIARMLGGITITEQARTHAREMLKNAERKRA